MNEKRKYTRFKNDRFKINQLIAYGPNREEYVFAEGSDVSRDGLAGSSKQSVEPLTNVFLMIRVPSPEGDRQVRCEGYISRSESEAGRCFFGVKITSVYEPDAPAFDAFLDAMEAQGKEPGGSAPPSP